ncbi:DUF2730 family protein [Candidatus Tokpelaia sp.]|uniref:DUF2730 family protein n=1 Tax=Candidatus Tokpelaia sp. TaxID=2233777 RepID=UPI00123A554A|nr:DUF2730 family protein [Candidatus Tokpelaia sp.]KAA6405657.1 DUF2730 domain-containing protein [Candidatus Tokpelaia sp.]
MTFDIAVIGAWVAFILSVISLAGLIKSHFTGGTKENTEAIKELDSKHDKLDKRVQKVETELKHLPNKDDFTKLAVSFAEMKGDIKVMSHAAKSTERSTRRMEDFLLGGVKGKEKK